MAAYNSFVKASSMMITSLLLVIFLCFPLFSYSTKTITVQEICSKHTNASFCINILNPKAGSDLATLGQYTITLAHTNAFDTITLIHSLIGKTTDPQLKQRYTSCAMDYSNVLLRLNDASKSLSSGDYNGMNSAANDVTKDVGDCDSKPPATDPSSLPKNNKDLENIALILVIIANFLNQN